MKIILTLLTCLLVASCGSDPPPRQYTTGTNHPSPGKKPSVVDAQPLQTTTRNLMSSSTRAMYAAQDLSLRLQEARTKAAELKERGDKAYSEGVREGSLNAKRLQDLISVLEQDLNASLVQEQRLRKELEELLSSGLVLQAQLDGLQRQAVENAQRMTEWVTSFEQQRHTLLQLEATNADLAKKLDQANRSSGSGQAYGKIVWFVIGLITLLILANVVASRFGLPRLSVTR